MRFLMCGGELGSSNTNLTNATMRLLWFSLILAIRPACLQFQRGIIITYFFTRLCAQKTGHN